jgi:hypothetical protein
MDVYTGLSKTITVDILGVVSDAENKRGIMPQFT